MNQEQQLQAIRERWRKVSEFPGNHMEYPLQNYSGLGEGISVFVSPKYVGVTEHIRKMPDDIATLLHMVEERDAIIHDLMIDGSSLARRAVWEALAKLWDWMDLERRHQMTLKGDYHHGSACTFAMVQGEVKDRLPNPTYDDPLPPDQARAEAERLRAKLRKIREQIAYWFDCVENWRAEWPGTEKALRQLSRMANEDTP